MDIKYISRLLRSIMLWLLYATQSLCQYSEDTCNWIIWDGAQDSRGIRNIRPECVEGNVQWRHPHGAIRIIFSQNNHASFQLCFIAHSTQATIKISSESQTHLKHLTLLTMNSPETDGEVCINSLHGDDVVLFVETVSDSKKAQVGVLDIDYEIRKTVLSMNSPTERASDCRPCTDEEIENIICYADFVARGTIRHVEEKPHRGESEVNLSVNKLYRQTHPVFKPLTDESTKSDEIEHFQQEKIDKNSPNDPSNIPTHSGHVIVPHACRTKRGTGEFIFIGKIRLKRAHLSCAPRAKDFDRLWTQVMRSGQNACVL